MALLASPRPPLALIANHQEWSVRTVESILAPQGYAILRAYTGQQTIDLAGEASPDVILLDADFSDVSSVEVCRAIRDNPHVSPSAPIFITAAGRWSREQRLEALSAGAWDFIGLPLDAEAFVLRLGTHMRVKFACDRSREESLIDQLTGLYNLKGLMRRVRELERDAYRNSRPLACVAFSPEVRIQRRQGKGGVGESALWAAVDHLARLLRETGRISDAIGRVRLGEFVVIAPGTDDAGAYRLAARIAAAADTSEWQGWEHYRLSVMAGYDAVHDVRAADKTGAALLAGATTALRRSQTEPGGPAIRRYDGNGLPSRS